ncbi:virulence protein [Candidatus Saccharibacteria bacterium]|nr:virulence protein [Candidatus Saccharibacteria bacterium]
MEIKLTLHGHRRKEAADCIGSAIGVASVYRAAPSFCYNIGGIILDRQNIVTIGDADEGLSNVLRNLETAGFYTPELAETAPDSPPTEAPERLCIQMPLDGFPDDKIDILRKLIASKASLIQKAISAEELPIVPNGETLDFPWFNVNATPEEVNAYAQFCSKLCDMAKKQQRVLAVERDVDSEKYAFRCFLLRLGFIGEEYAVSRKILLRNLSGNGSHRSGNGKPRQLPTTSELADNADDTNDGSGGAEVEPEAEPKAKPKHHFMKKLFGALKLFVLN